MGRSSVLAIDLGTSSVKAFVMSPEGNCLYRGSENYPSFSPAPLCFEQRPEDWVHAMTAAILSIPEPVRGEISAISFSGHMSSAVLVDADGNALTPCLTLTDQRGRGYMPSLAALSDRSAEINGNRLAETAWAAKVRWLLDLPGVRARADKVLFAKDYLRLYLTGRAAGEYTDAGNSGMIRFDTGRWDDEAVKASGIPGDVLPELSAPFDKAGELLPGIAGRIGLKSGLPVYFGGADMACGALGSGLRDGCKEISVTLGSSATMLMAIDAKTDIASAVGKISFHPYVARGTRYALGSHFTGGIGANWMGGLFGEGGLEPDFDLLDRLAEEAAEVPAGADGLLMLPFLAGSGSPYNRGADKSVLMGMTLSTGRGAIFRAMLEGIAMNLRETAAVFERLAGRTATVYLGGGGVRIGPWASVIADVFGRELYLLKVRDASALGAAMIGAYGAGLRVDIYPEMAVSDDPIGFDPKNHDVYQEKMREFRRYYELLSPEFNAGCD